MSRNLGVAVLGELSVSQLTLLPDVNQTQLELYEILLDKSKDMRYDEIDAVGALIKLTDEFGVAKLGNLQVDLYDLLQSFS
jgi:hypothetical protein